MIENCRKFYGKLFSDLKPDVAAIEMGIMGGHSDGLTIARQAQLAGQVMWVAYMKGVPCWEIPQGTWRKSFIGWGTPKKGQTETMKALAVRRCLELGWDYHRDHNEAESGGILDHLITCIQGETPPWRLPRPSALPPEDDVALPF
jgi:Holliday junction resolvasome RuvABC endonuclease subunit